MISIILITFNRKNDLEDAVNSILKQKNVELELLLIDNNSEDDTENYAQNLVKRDARVRYFRMPRNVGIPAAFNKGLSEGRGDVFFGFDDDQWIEDELFLKKTLDFDTDQPWDIMTTRLINPDGNDEPFFVQKLADDKGFYVGNFLNGAVFIKRCVVKRIGMMESTYFRQGQENEYAMRAVLAGFNILYQPNIVIYHKRNPYRPDKRLVAYFMLRNTLLKNYKYFQGWQLTVLNTWQILQFATRMLCGKITPILLLKAVIDYSRMKLSIIRHLDYARKDMERFFFVSREIAHQPEEIRTLGFWPYCLSGVKRFF